MIRRFFFFLLMSFSILCAKEYDDTVMDIEAKIFPKIAILEEKIAQNASPYLTIAIVYKEPDYDVAQRFKQKIEATYPNKIRAKKVRVTLVEFGSTHISDTDALLVLAHEAQELETIAIWANKHKMLTFAYEPAYLEYGLIASIYIGRTTKPYLNAQAIKKYDFVFDSYLLQLSKFKE